MIPTLFIFFVKGILADVLLVLFLEKEKTIFEDWMHQMPWVMNGIQRSCTSWYYIWFRKKNNIWEWAVFFHIITIALGSYWQTVTEMRAPLRKKKSTVLVAIDIYRWMKMKGEGTNLLKMRNFKGIQLINASWGSLEEQINSNPEGNSKLKNDNTAKKSLGVNVKLCLRDKWKAN